MKAILRNFAWCEDYSDRSFIGRFHEECIWDDAEYFRLEDALYALCEKTGGDPTLEREIAWPIFRIYSYLMFSMGCVQDTRDVFALDNVTGEQFHARKERLQLVFEGFFNGNMISKDHLDY